MVSDRHAIHSLWRSPIAFEGLFWRAGGQSGACAGSRLRRGIVSRRQFVDLSHGELQDLGSDMDIWLVGFVSAAFISVAGITFSVGHLVTSRNRLQRRLPAGSGMSDALTLSPVDNMGVLVAEPFTEGVLGISQKVSKELRLKLVRAGYFSPQRGPVLRSRARMRRRCCAGAGFTGLHAAVARISRRSLLRSLRPRLVGVGVLGPDAYLVTPPVLANRRVSREFSGSPGSVDSLRHSGSDRGGVIRENPRPARQAKPRAWPQHRVDGSGDASGEKLRRRA